MESEIISGLKNAIERGQPIEKAVSSFINAGYNPHEVREAAKNISGGASGIIYEGDDHADVPLPEVPKRTEAKEVVERTGKKKGKRGFLVFVIILALLIFLGALGYLIFTLSGG